MAALLAALVREERMGHERRSYPQLEEPHRYPVFLTNGEPPHPPLCVVSPINALANLRFSVNFVSLYRASKWATHWLATYSAHRT